VTVLVLGTLIHFLEFNHSILKHLEINIHIRAKTYIQHVSASTTKNILINHTSIHLYIYIHQSRPYQHLSTHNHPLVIILLGNSNNQSCVMYIYLCSYLILISTVQSEEQYVLNHLPKFHLNRTVNESRNAVLRKLRQNQ